MLQKRTRFEMNALSRLKLWQKLAVLVVAMAAPTVLLGFFYLERSQLPGRHGT